ncbi:hypothetical protein LXL04_017403 [Taraxacum kok-saghyz]
MSSFINFKNYKPMCANSPTFDELQNTCSGNGKNLGSRNMDEFLKNIWTPEETQSMTSSSNLGIIGNLQKQGSLTIPRTVSQKKVDEVWRDLLKENGDVGLIKEPTLGEMTLEDFLHKSGAIAENDKTHVIQNQGFHQDSVFTDGKNDNLRKILPKKSDFDFRSSVNNDRISSRENGFSINGKIDHLLKTDYPSELYQNSKFDTSPSPSPSYGGGHGRKRSGTVEKVVERRQKRMIKNRESASRSRARKQAYILELEAEVAKLKEDVKKKQEEIMKSKNIQMREKMKLFGSGRSCLRRTLTGPW